MYPRDKCYFCGEVLVNCCDNLECYNKYRYWVGSDYIRFEIEEYEFKFYYGSPLLYNMAIGDSTKVIFRCLVDKHWEITTDNYLKQVERARKLQVFK